MFHPAVRQWFERQFNAPTPAQEAAWPAIKGGAHTLIAAPTGSGKTLAAFLCAIDDLVREELDRGLSLIFNHTESMFKVFAGILYKSKFGSKPGLG